MLDYITNQVPQEFSDLRIEQSIVYFNPGILNFEFIGSRNLYALNLKEVNLTDKPSVVSELSYISIKNGEFDVSEKLLNEYLLLQQHQYNLRLDDFQQLSHENLIERWNTKRYKEASTEVSELLILMSISGHIVGSCRVSINTNNPEVAYIEDIGVIEDYREDEIFLDLMYHLLTHVISEFKSIQYLVIEDEHIMEMNTSFHHFGFTIWKTFNSYRWDRNEWGMLSHYQQQ